MEAVCLLLLLLAPASGWHAAFAQEIPPQWAGSEASRAIAGVAGGAAPAVPAAPSPRDLCPQNSRSKRAACQAHARAILLDPGVPASALEAQEVAAPNAAPRVQPAARPLAVVSSPSPRIRPSPSPKLASPSSRLRASPSPRPRSPSPAPRSPSPVPRSPSPMPISPSPAAPSPSPVRPSPSPVAPSPSPVPPSPSPVAPSPSPVWPSPSPVADVPSPSPADASPSPELVNEEASPSPEPADAASPSPLLESDSPSPEPQGAASPSPDLLPSPSLDLLPSPSPDLLPSPSPDLLPSPSPDLLPSPSPDLLPSPSPAVAGPSCGPAGSIYKSLFVKPRVMWNSSYGFCGEDSVQMTAMTRGVWVSQRSARLLGVGKMNNDLILEDRASSTGVLVLVKKRLGFNQPPDTYWASLGGVSTDNQTCTPYNCNNSNGTTTPPATAYVSWVKRMMLSGKPVIMAFRLKYTGASGFEDPWYDHIMPFYGLCYDPRLDTSAVQPSDIFTSTSDYGDEFNRSVSTPGFYSQWHMCPFDNDKGGQGGCIASDAFNYGLALGDLAAPAGLYLPSRLLITAPWSDGTRADSEPGETAASTATTTGYQVTVLGLTPGLSYRIHRFQPNQGSTTVYVLPQSLAALMSACDAVRAVGRCSSLNFTASAESMDFTQASLGAFPAYSITYFLTTRL